MFVPFGSLFSAWHHAAEYSTFVGEKHSKILMFILWLVFNPEVWFLVQSDLNRGARYTG